MTLLPLFTIEVAAFFLGLLLGSFLNVCIARLPEHRSLSRPRSHCPVCAATIRWYDNLPLLSWLLLRAKCRHCGAAISWRYPAVELATALWFAAIAARAWIAASSLHNGPASALADSQLTGVFFAAAGALVLGFLLIGLIVMDWRTHTLPDAFTWPGMVLGFLLVCARSVFLAPGQDDVKLTRAPNINSANAGRNLGNVFMTGAEADVLGRLGAIVLAVLLLLAIRTLYRTLRKREGMGAGDVKLLGMIAAFLGFWPALLAFFTGAVACSLWAAILLARRRADLATRLPFGSFLAAGGLCSALVGGPLIAWYRGLL